METNDELNELIAATENQGKPLIIKQCPPCKFIAPYYDEMIEKYPNLVVKMSFLLPQMVEHTGTFSMPTMRSYVNGVEYECVQGVDKAEMISVFEKA